MEISNLHFSDEFRFDLYVFDCLHFLGGFLGPILCSEHAIQVLGCQSVIDFTCWIDLAKEQLTVIRLVDSD